MFETELIITDFNDNVYTRNVNIARLIEPNKIKENVGGEVKRIRIPKINSSGFNNPRFDVIDLTAFNYLEEFSLGIDDIIGVICPNNAVRLQIDNELLRVNLNKPAFFRNFDLIQNNTIKDVVFRY